MDNEPALYVVPSLRNKRTHIVGDSVISSVCGVGVGIVSKMTLQRLDVDYLAGDNGICKRCKAISTRLYLGWVNSLTEYDLVFTEGQ